MSTPRSLVRTAMVLNALALPAGLTAGSNLAMARVEVDDHQLLVDGEPAPFLFGAEVQYFRARGGPGRNVPKAEVERLWDLALDRVQEAHMNLVSFYIPWDFHEPVEGTFDFTGTLDRDGDGHPDYPSRDVLGFIRHVQAHGIKYVMIRPGPYINAEWGPTGFGAVPLWFLDRYPEALAGNRTPGKAPVATFAHPVFRERVKRWFTALNDQVFRQLSGPGKPAILLQLDNETNYFWDSVYERDLSPTGLARYRGFLAGVYGNDIKRLNQAYGSAFAEFAAVMPPADKDDRTYNGFGWHYDWFNWHDEEIRDYFRFLRATWESLGIREPNVLFTRCDSFNPPDHGLLPRLDFGQDGGLALSTLNIYPKTYGAQALSTMNTPMKAAHDATLLGAAHRQFYGKAGQWVMATETVGGWFPPTEVSLATRQHTYGTLLGNGVKAMVIYYFHEGYNWNGLEQEDGELRFDAPLDRTFTARPAFGLIRDFGLALSQGLGDALLRAAPVRAPVLIAHDNWTQYPMPGRTDASLAASTDSGALFGLFRAAGALPDVAFVDRMDAAALSRYQLVVWRHPGYIGQDTLGRLRAHVAAGGTLVVIGDSANEVDVTAQGEGQVIRLADDPAAGWNGDDYPRLANAGASLALAKQLLAQAHVSPLVDVQANGQEPFLHVWLQRTEDTGGASQRMLLYAENFGRSPLTATLRIAEGALPPGGSFVLNPRLVAGAGVPNPMTVSRLALTTTGVALPVSADGVDLWDLSSTLDGG